MKPKATHRSFPKGKNILVMLRDGTHFVDRFVESKSDFMVFETRGKVKNSEIRSTNYYRAPRHG